MALSPYKPQFPSPILMSPTISSSTPLSRPSLAARLFNKPCFEICFVFANNRASQIAFGVSYFLIHPPQLSLQMSQSPLGMPTGSGRRTYAGWCVRWPYRSLPKEPLEHHRDSPGASRQSLQRVHLCLATISSGRYHPQECRRKPKLTHDGKPNKRSWIGA